MLSHHDAALNHLKPTLDEALPHRPYAYVTPLEASAGDLPAKDLDLGIPDHGPGRVEFG
jgi:hypothetical protein